MKSSSSAEERTKKIILIEDDDLVRVSIGRYLDLSGYEVKIFASGEEALQTICSNSPDIILTDFNLPGMNGLELTKIIRNKNMTIPVILISAIQGSDFESTAVSGGIAAVFTKPINVGDLKNTIDRLTETDG